MSGLDLLNADVLFPVEGEVKKRTVRVKNGIIEDNNCQLESTQKDNRGLDLEGYYLSPGFIDLQVNGGAGIDFLTSSPGEPKRTGNFWLEYGTTSFLGTVITHPDESMRKAISNMLKANPPNLLGVHVEGPFLSYEKRGTHNKDHILKPDREVFETIVSSFEDEVKLFTFAPELENSEPLLDWINNINAVPSIGHTNATYDEIRAFIDKGVSSFTHLFNGMKGFHHREPGTVGAALNSESYVGLIVDGQHVSPGAVKLAEKTKKIGKVCLVTDAIAAAGMKDGTYLLGNQDIIVDNGLAKNENGTIAGSTLTLNSGLRNFIEFTGCTLEEAIKTVTLNPAKLLNLEDRIGTMETGSKADLVVFDREFQVKYTIIDGEVVFKDGS